MDPSAVVGARRRGAEISDAPMTNAGTPPDARPVTERNSSVCVSMTSACTWAALA